MRLAIICPPTSVMRLSTNDSDLSLREHSSTSISSSMELLSRCSVVSFGSYDGMRNTNALDSFE
jgi:hypothetical protein